MFVSYLCFLFVDYVCFYWCVRPDHQSPGSPLSPMDFLAPSFSYLPENSCSVFFLAFISSILFPCPIPTLSSFCSQPSSLLSTSIPRWALLFTQFSYFSTLIILKFLYPTMTSFPVFKPMAPTVYSAFPTLYSQLTPSLKYFYSKILPTHFFQPNPSPYFPFPSIVPNLSEFLKL